MVTAVCPGCHIEGRHLDAAEALLSRTPARPVNAHARARCRRSSPVRREIPPFSHACTHRLHAFPSCQICPRLLYSNHGPQSPSSLVCCCDFRDGAARPALFFMPLECPFYAAFRGFLLSSRVTARPPTSRRCAPSPARWAQKRTVAECAAPISR